MGLTDRGRATVRWWGMKPTSPLRHLASILVLPGMVTAVIPVTLFLLTRRWQPVAIPTWGRLVLVALGAAALVLGLWLVVSTVLLFARVGKGTLAPWDPTRKLVVEGPFRHVRNPMISGVAFVLLGEALGTASVPVLLWCVFFSVVNAIYIPLSEEPGLVRRFGEDYERYRKHVPRWIPRRTAWTPPDT